MYKLEGSAVRMWMHKH